MQLAKLQFAAGAMQEAWSRLRTQACQTAQLCAECGQRLSLTVATAMGFQMSCRRFAQNHTALHCLSLRRLPHGGLTTVHSDHSLLSVSLVVSDHQMIRSSAQLSMMAAVGTRRSLVILHGGIIAAVSRILRPKISTHGCSLPLLF